MVKRISPVELKEWMESDRAHAVLDVRDPMEFHEKQIFMTTNAPRGAVEFLAERLVPVKSTPVVCVDEGGPRAGARRLVIGRMRLRGRLGARGRLGRMGGRGFPNGLGHERAEQGFRRADSRGKRGARDYGP